MRHRHFCGKLGHSRGEKSQTSATAWRKTPSPNLVTSRDAMTGLVDEGRAGDIVYRDLSKALGTLP